MKITKLYIKNINSLKGEHSINFDEAPLASTGLFAITGPTGAGKSTLLDSITLALYNQIPRSGKLSKKSIQEFGTLITRGTDECLVELDFQVNGKLYRSKWGISRARTGNLRDYHMELSFQKEDGEWELFDLKKSDIPGKNAELTGLNYDQFVKSILLSQGEFAKFLKAPQNERSELLEKITGTEIYREIGKAAYERWKREDELLKQIQLKIEHIDLLSEEEKLNLIEEQKRLKRDSEEIRKVIQNLLNQLKVKEEIRQLTANQQKTTVLLQEVENKQKAFAPELERLQQHKQILPLQADIRELQTNQQENQNLLDAIEKISTTLKTQEIENKKRKNQLEEQQSQHCKLKEEFTVLEPKLKVCLQLDEQIKNQKKQNAELKEAARKKEKESTDGQTDLNQQKKKEKEIEQNISKLNLFLEKNRKLEDFPVLNEKLGQQLGGIKEAHSGLNQEVQQLSQQWQEDFKKGQNWLTKEQMVSNQVQECESHIKEWKAQLMHSSFQNREELNQLLEKWNQEKDCIQEVKQLFVSYQQDAKKSDELQKEFLELQKKMQDLKAFNEKHQPLLEIKIIEEKEYQLKVERLKMESSLATHRANLKVEEACPLCGSLDHPYVKSYEEKTDDAQEHLKKIRKEKDKLDKQLQSNEKALTAKLSEQKYLEKQQSELKENINKTTQQFQEVKKKLQLSFDLEQEDLFQIYSKERTEAGKKLYAERDLFEKKENESVKLQLLQRILEKVSVISKAQQSIEHLLESVLQFVSPEASVGDKMKQLKKQYDQYVQQSKELLEVDKQKLQIKEKIKSLEELTVRFNKEKEELNGRLSEMNENLQKLQKNRFDLLGDKSVEKEQQRWTDLLSDIRKQCEQKEKDLAVAMEKRSNMIKSHKETQEKQQKLIRSIQLAEKKLLNQLESYQIHELSIASQRLLSEEKAKEIEQQKMELEEQKVALNQSRKEADEKLKALQERNSKIAYELLAQEKDEKEKLNNSLNQNIGAIDERQKKDEANRKLAGDYLKGLEKQQKECRRWANLNELIGDATGNKYSKFAQELTLRQMLSLANQHLLKLNPRYLLKFNAQQNEDLFVVDTLQGNEERSVKTLSGGESFLISLALALGLSDLAGQNTQLESLFIDEGFGSLDQETLESALETLERLQSESNRTIGIISHVEALKERITTQIELVKDSRGNSEIFIR